MGVVESDQFEINLHMNQSLNIFTERKNFKRFQIFYGITWPQNERDSEFSDIDFFKIQLKAYNLTGKFQRIESRRAYRRLAKLTLIILKNLIFQNSSFLSIKKGVRLCKPVQANCLQAFHWRLQFEVKKNCIVVLLRYYFDFR